jgi:hypothetical protein
MHIHLVPDGGLSHRMRAVDPAYAMDRGNNSKRWVQRHQDPVILTCPYENTERAHLPMVLIPAYGGAHRGHTTHHDDEGRIQVGAMMRISEGPW